MNMMARIATATAKFMERQSEPGRHPDCLYLGFVDLGLLFKECEGSLTVELQKSERGTRSRFRGMNIYVVDELNHLAVGRAEP